MLCLQGPHQVAQNSTTYTCPGSNFVTGSPLSHLATGKAGAASPTFSLGSAAPRLAARLRLSRVAAIGVTALNRTLFIFASRLINL